MCLVLVPNENPVTSYENPSTGGVARSDRVGLSFTNAQPTHAPGGAYPSRGGIQADFLILAPPQGGETTFTAQTANQQLKPIGWGCSGSIPKCWEEQ